MSLRPISAADALDQFDTFDTVLDVRSPGEFAEDRLPGAQNWPVLDDAQRAEVGTLYKQQSPFAAKKLGAALIARNIAAHIERGAMDWPKSQRVLVYCWRGGNRSGAMAHVLAQIGFAVHLVEGGYKALRAALVVDLARRCTRQTMVVVAGPTGSGKTRLLQAMPTQGLQALDLEALACHRGSVLGAVGKQPPQRLFESRIWDVMRRTDPAQPLFVESESRKIGRLQLPAALVERMHASACLLLQASVEQRVDILLRDYAALLDQPEEICLRLGLLIELRGRARVEHWQQLAMAAAWRELSADLLEQHYDPAYQASMRQHYAGLDQAPCYVLSGSSDTDFAALASRLGQDFSRVAARQEASLPASRAATADSH